MALLNFVLIIIFVCFIIVCVVAYRVYRSFRDVAKKFGFKGGTLISRKRSWRQAARLRD